MDYTTRADAMAQANQATTFCNLLVFYFIFNVLVSAHGFYVIKSDEDGEK